MALPVAGTGGEQDQFWPMPKFYFSVDIGDDTDIAFQEVSGLDVESEVIEYRHGNSPNHSVIKMPGMMKFSDITLKKGVFADDNTFLCLACFVTPLFTLAMVLLPLSYVLKKFLLIILSSDLARIVVPLAFLINLFVLFIMPCLFPA